MPKPDRRKERTLQKLAEACTDLMLEIGYDRISVRGLARRAGVGSSTFYRHFQDKDDLLMSIVQSFCREMSEAVVQAHSPREEAVYMYRFIQQHQQIVRLYLSLPPDKQARRLIKETFAEIVRQRYRPMDSSNVDPDIAVNHILAATDELNTFYLDNINAYNPEEMAEIFCNLIVRATTEVAFEPREEWLQRFS